MSSVTVCNCPQNTPDPACLQAVSSRQSDQQQKKPDGRTCWAGERRLDDCWPNADAGGKQCQIWVCSGWSDTEELGCAGIGTWAHRAYTGLKCNVTRSNFHVCTVNSNNSWIPERHSTLERSMFGPYRRRHVTWKSVDSVDGAPASLYYPGY